MKPPRSALKIVRMVIGSMLVIVMLPCVIVLTWKLAAGNEFAFGGHAQRLLLICILIALIGAGMVGKLKLPSSGSDKPPDSTDANS